MNKEDSEQLKELNDKWDLHDVVKAAVESAHTSPSPATLRELKIAKDERELLKETNKQIMEKLDNFIDESRQHHQDVEIKIAELPKKLADEFDTRYASKLSENIVYGLVGLIVTGVIVGLLSLIVNHV